MMSPALEIASVIAAISAYSYAKTQQAFVIFSDGYASYQR
jgi:hypothetical protein